MSKLLIKQLDKAPLSPDDSNPNKYTIESWEDIFLIQARKYGANYQMLKAWLIKYFDKPNLKP